MFKRMEILKTVYETVLEPFYKKLLEKILTMLTTTGKIEEKLPHKTFTLRWVNVLESASKGIFIVRGVGRN